MEEVHLYQRLHPRCSEDFQTLSGGLDGQTSPGQEQCRITYPRRQHPHMSVCAYLDALSESLTENYYQTRATIVLPAVSIIVCFFHVGRTELACSLHKVTMLFSCTKKTSFSMTMG